MEEKQAFTDIFSVGYNNTNENKTILVIGRDTKSGIDVINVFKDEEAEELYKKLITPTTLKRG